MAKEIERKFLVENTNFKVSATHSYEITQGYLSRRIDSTVRVRIKDDKAFLTVKGATMEPCATNGNMKSL